MLSGTPLVDFLAYDQGRYTSHNGDCGLLLLVDVLLLIGRTHGSYPCMYTTVRGASLPTRTVAAAMLLLLLE